MSAVILLLAVGTAAAAEGPVVSSMATAGLKVVWQTQVPLGLTTSIKSYHLVGGQIYAIASDGVVHVLRADNGDYLWARKLGEEFDVLWPPFLAPLPTTAAERTGLAAGSRGTSLGKMEVVVFTRVIDVLFIDPATGQIVRRVPLHTANNAAVAITPQGIVQVSAGQRVNRLSIKDGFPDWQHSTSATLMLAPLYLPDDDAFYIVDEAGVLLGVRSTSLERMRPIELNATPRGWLAVDQDAIYSATTDRYLHAVERKSGIVRWQYQLADRPRGGPVVIGDSVYQSLEKGGVQRVGKDATRPNWLDADALVALAQWKDQAALLRPSGVVALWNLKQGELARAVRVGNWADGGISNPWNDAMIVTGKDGRLACLQPARSNPLTLAAFRPAEPAPVTRPTTRPSATATPEAAGTVSSDQRLLDDPLRSERRVSAP